MSELTVILSSSPGRSPLPGVWPATHNALIPICGKPVIVHQIERLAAAGYQKFRIPRGADQHALRARLAFGEEWGVDIRYSDLTTAELMDVSLARLTQVLLVPADNLGLGGIENLLCHSKKNTYRESAAVSSYLPGHWQCSEVGELLHVPLQECATIHSPGALHEQNLAALKGDLGVFLPGRQLHSQNAIGDWRCSVSKSAFLGANVFVGKQALVAADARIEKNALLANGVIVGENVSLKNVTVMPNTMILPNAKFEDAVLCQQGYYPLSSSLQGGEVVASSFLKPSRGNKSDRTGLPLDESFQML